MDEAAHLEILVRVTLKLAQQRHIYPQGVLKRLAEAQAAIVRELILNHTPRPEWLADWGKKRDAIQAAAKDPAERVRIAKLAAEARWRGHTKGTRSSAGKPKRRKRNGSRKRKRLGGISFHRERTLSDWSKVLECRKHLKRRFGYCQNAQGEGVRIGNAFTKEVTSAKAMDKSNANGYTDKQHLNAALSIRELWGNAVFLREELPNARKKNQRGVTWRKYKATFKTEGKECSVKLTVKYVTNEDENILYSLELLP